DAQLSVHHDGAAVAELVADVEADRVGHVVPAVHVDRLDLPLAVDARRAGLLEALLEELDRVGEGGTQAQRTATGLDVEGQLGLVAVADGENAELVVGGAVGADETLVDLDPEVAVRVPQAVETEVGVQLALPAGPALLRAGVADVVQAGIALEGQGPGRHAKLEPGLDVEDHVADFLEPAGLALAPAREGIVAGLELRRRVQAARTEADAVAAIVAQPETRLRSGRRRV